jgi:hypothetical protein
LVAGLGNSRAEDEATFSGLRPSDDRFAVGEPDSEHGESSMILRRLEGGSAEGAAGESTKKDPSPGEPSIDPARDGQGEADAFDMTRAKAGESTSMASLAAILASGDKIGSV